MKVYLISNVSSGGEEMVDAFDQANVNVVSKEMRYNIERISQNLQSVATQGNSDIMVLVTDESIEASIELNKKEDIRAAVCNSAEDVERAREKDVNLIIVPNEAQRKEEIAEAIIRTNKGIGRMFSVTRTKDRRKQEMVEEEDDKRTYKARSEDRERKEEREAEKAEKEEKAEEADEEQEKGVGNRKGIIGKIKDSLGIID